jgi:ribosomal protein S18 acetylase RimI-like enzyme
MKIRTYQDEDFPELESILKLTNLYEMDYDDRENYKSQIESDTASILVAEEDDVVGGLISLFTSYESFIFHLCVHPQYQKRGIGTQLMEEAEKKFRDRGVKRIAIYVIDQNVVSFYTKRGWKVFPQVTPMEKEI